MPVVINMFRLVVFKPGAMHPVTAATIEDTLQSAEGGISACLRQAFGNALVCWFTIDPGKFDCISFLRGIDCSCMKVGIIAWHLAGLKKVFSNRSKVRGNDITRSPDGGNKQTVFGYS